MKRLEPAVIKNTAYIAAVDLLLSLIMQSVFLTLSRWSAEVLFGNVLGYLASVGNFFLLCLTVQSAVNKEEDDAKKLIAMSQRLRLLMMLAVAIVGYLVPFFNLYAAIIPFLFNGIAVFISSRFIKVK